jgi:HEAT repeat protein
VTLSEISSLTDRIDRRIRQAESSALTDEPWDFSQNIQWVHDIPYGTVRAVSLLLGVETTSLEEALPKIQRTISDYDERAWTADVGTEDRHAFESSTVQLEGQIRMDSYIKAIFEAATQYVFEDGMDSEFSEELARLVRQCGNAAIDIMGYLILSETVNVEVASEALRSLGEIYHPQSHTYRLRLLQKGLGASSYWVRDGAALGLASLNDPLAIPHLRKAMQQERVKELREDMEKVLGQLERTRLCPSL